MAGSSPASRRSQPLSSPDRSRVSSFLSENRNTELNHQNALAAAAAEHDRVREAAIRTFNEHVLEEEQKRLLERQESILQQQRKEEERIRTEELLRVEEERLRALKLKTVPKLPPEPEPEPKPEPQASPVQVNGFAAHKEPVQPVPEASKETASSAKPSPLSPQQPTILKNPFAQVNGTGSAQTSPLIPPNPFKRTEPISQTSTQSPQGKAPGTASPFAQSFASGPPQQNGVSTSAPVRPPVVADVDPYIKIHKNLKQLRASLTEQAKRFPALKRRMGDMRRELRKNIGQLVGEKGGNRKQYAAIQALLDESLNGSVPSELIDPSVFITDRREPVQGASRNEPHLPSLFLYLLNQFSKAIINQFINECGAQPKSADPIGVTAAMIFAKDAYSWRGKTLIDILMAKFRVVCPVLFGYRGSEKTDQGRVRLGWKKDKSSGVWIPEQQHIDRMKGLGAGYSSIALRNFSKASTENPWPPRHYWTCMAKIVNTPGNEISNTQCVVLRAIIEENEDRFVQFYGSAAIAALRKALVEFPGRASDQKLPGVAGLTVMASMLKRDIGLEL
ncbi:GLE1-domain-containing protein [Hypoxylon rubiginosum]|uniref:GLE1-domain-containing protein n=1 Tax=Hypoxylon rubiginosum TaxID=110542 RepID=A0ACC0DL95_9PEZI|nr:GLE1-domain-containing protein [Hypoxylon rubiginosum]